MRRAGFVLVALMLIVFGTETMLARLRRRDLTIAVSVQHTADSQSSALSVTAQPTVQGTAGATAAATDPATTQPNITKTPAPSILTLTPTDELLVTVTWDYSIGP